MPTTGEWIIETELPREETDEFLATHGPWRSAFRFSNGSSSRDHKTFQPFNAAPLNKFAMAAEHIPAEAFSGWVLDVGFNYGYNAMHVADRYGCEAIGIENNSKHKLVADWIAKASGSKASFVLGDAESYQVPRLFSVVLHFGTLYHLANPGLALQSAVVNLRPGGWLALETVAYIGDGAERGLNRFIFGLAGDVSNTWAISKRTLEELLTGFGMGPPKLIKEVGMAVYEGQMSRVLYVAQKLSP